MKPILCWLIIVAGVASSARADLVLAAAGQPKCVILRQAGATSPEQWAAKDLADTLKQITGATFRIQEAGADLPKQAIIIGPGPAAKALFPNIDLAQLAPEELVIQTQGNYLLLAGGRPRGTLYAVSTFLKDQCGVRWWTPWASRVPQSAELRVGSLKVQAKPAFEYREPFWYPAFNAEWAVRNRANGQSSRIPQDLGGCIRYKGFVHTFFPLVPPEKYFAEHPEWYSLLKTNRTSRQAQLCLSNPKLREFVVERVKQWLRESPEAGILSVSQNDWHGACECADCKALDDAEGSRAGSLLAFVNYVAEKIEPEFPHVAIDTLAYQYTRKPPKSIKPRPNVIVRLCSIECNFREPLDNPVNATFAADIKGWAKMCQRLYIWDYTTDFAHYVQPHPNWFTLGPNLRFFQEHNVRGVFEQGAYQSHGSEMAELRGWVLAQLLWNPRADDRALINEFLEGYYGPDAAPHLRKYLELMYEGSKGHNLTCYSGTDAPFLRFPKLAQAEQLWRQAETAAAQNADYLTRVRVGHLPLGYVWLSRWSALRKQCQESSATWPLPESRKAAAADWGSVAKGQPNAPWTKIALLNEGGLTLDKFIGRFAEDPAEAKPQ
jgi:hypothetical protein